MRIINYYQIIQTNNYVSNKIYLLKFHILEYNILSLITNQFFTSFIIL